MADLSVIDIKSLCRTCLQPSPNLESLFETLFDNSTLSKLLVQVTPSLINPSFDDKLSNYICGECRSNAINAFKFQQMCVDSERRIRSLIDGEMTFENEIKTEVGGDISQDGLSMMGKLEATFGNDLQGDSSDVLLTELKPIEEDDDEFDNDDTDSSESNSGSDDDDVNRIKKYNCDSCSREFRSARKLEQHVMNEHQRSKSAGSEDNESSEDDDETAKIFTCDSCPKRFKKPSLLARHIKTHDPNKRPHECSKCQKRFPSQVALVRHDILHSELVERSKINRPEAQFSCVICSRLFKSPESLSCHLKTHKNKSPEDQEYTCKLCHDVFPTFTDITRHSKNHLENATHQCAICNKLFVVSDELIDHFLRHKGTRSNLVHC